jgi:hypothetical protein
MTDSSAKTILFAETITSSRALGKILWLICPLDLSVHVTMSADSPDINLGAICNHAAGDVRARILAIGNSLKSFTTCGLASSCGLEKRVVLAYQLKQVVKELKKPADYSHSLACKASALNGAHGLAVFPMLKHITHTALKNLDPRKSMSCPVNSDWLEDYLSDVRRVDSTVNRYLVHNEHFYIPQVNNRKRSLRQENRYIPL